MGDAAHRLLALAEEPRGELHAPTGGVESADVSSHERSTHTAVGGLLGLDARELDRNRSGQSVDERTAAALTFALTVNVKRGGVSDDDLAEIRVAGYDDADIAAIVAHVALNVLTNYFNRVAQPVIDFPEVTPRVVSTRLSGDEGGPAPHQRGPASRWAAAKVVPAIHEHCRPSVRLYSPMGGDGIEPPTPCL